MDDVKAETRKAAAVVFVEKQTQTNPIYTHQGSVKGRAELETGESVREESGFSLRFLRTLNYPQVNKTSLYIFGSVMAIEQERARQRETAKWVVHPLSPIKYYYVMFMLFLTILNILSVPLELAFSDEVTGIVFIFWLSFNLFSDMLFTIDIGLNFRMGILKDDSEVAVLDLKLIKHDYLRTWFVPDVLSSVSFDFIIILMISDENYLKILMLFRIIRLFMIIIMLCHWNGCIQYFVSFLDGFPPDSWIVRENILNATFAEKYSYCVFRALSHMLTVSYGSDYLPTNMKEMWIVMTSMVSGVFMYVILVANIAAMITNIDGPTQSYKCKMNHLEEYMTYRKLPKALRIRITDYYQARYRGKCFNEDILSLVSKSLKEEILTVMCAKLLKNAPVFQNCDINFINAILPKLQYEVFQEGDIIIQPHALADRMYFIEHGQVIMEAESFQKQLCDGDHFGDLALLISGKRLITVRALSTCHLFSLFVGSFQQALEDFPDAMTDMTKTAHQRLEDIRNAELKHIACSDDAELDDDMMEGMSELLN
ncbi:potassium/sodium hyperpolarization-activated cyclic nucleotide-gated channel 1-like isoform X2 [Hoplias malabaricus]|uniref:potassium/sodium hyperpolarization-activated cyclic nucleotide-gated channel 1-like isoform X2 n=1 Tax=Hoplias malabaricus TaxID=27720 RepID=UPI00346256E5